MEIETRKLEISFEKFKVEEGEDAPAFGICAYNRKRWCTLDCTALAIMAIPRTRLVKDAQTGQHIVVADRHPVVGPFCRRGNFPIGLNADENTIGEVKSKASNVDVA